MDEKVKNEGGKERKRERGKGKAIIMINVKSSINSVLL